MPHARLEGIEETLVAVATSEKGVRFPGSQDPVRLVVLVLAPASAPAGYLRVAAGVARRLQDPAFLDEIVARTTPADVCAFFRRGSAELPAEVCAADIMERPAAVLRETDSVKDAIDLIVRTGKTEIPVVDKEGALVGEASADEVLGLCIPDYLLWMEDLSVFSNFEPFATLLRKESSTWLADITSDDYASVTVDQPAIAVAEALARKDAGVCYVLDGDKLAGVVTLPHFLNKVFRD
jgi:CBS domain-containing protein